MKTRKPSKLQLHRETLRVLTDDELLKAPGGADSFSCPDPVFGNASGCQWSRGRTWFEGGGGGGTCVD